MDEKELHTTLKKMRDDVDFLVLKMANLGWREVQGHRHDPPLDYHLRRAYHHLNECVKIALKIYMEKVGPDAAMRG